MATRRATYVASLPALAPFDAQALEITGPATAVSANLRVGLGGAVDLAVSETGTLMFATGPGRQMYELVWVDRDGAAEPFDPAWHGDLSFPTLSPDGSRLAVLMRDTGGVNVWIRHLDRGTIHKLTVEGTINGYPSWTPDGASVTYYSNASPSVDLWTKPADGSAHAVLQLSRPRELAESLWSPDGEWLIYRTSNVPSVAASGSVGPLEGASDILAIRHGGEADPVPLATTPFAELSPSLSPDGRWLAYASEETGRGEVFVVPFPNVDEARWSVTPDGGSEPTWSHTTGELFFRSRGRMMAVEVQTTPTFSLGPSTVLFDARGYVISGLHQSYSVTPDDQRFVMIRRLRGDPGELIVVENWFEELKQRMGN